LSLRSKRHSDDSTAFSYGVSRISVMFTCNRYTHTPV